MSLSTKIRDSLWAFRQSRKAQVITLGILIFLVVTLAGYVLFAGGGSSKRSENTNSAVVNADREQLVRRAIDGVKVVSNRSNNFPVCVMIENLVEARPQSGLERANLVYEALAEGGITRFLAVFAGNDIITKIGPVRSARSYYLDWAKELDCLYAHAGGSPDALRKIPEYGIDDFNQFFNGTYFWRDSELRKTRAQEHTLFTSSELLARAFRDNNFPLVGTFSTWKFADDLARDLRPATPVSITIPFSTFNYKVDWTYDRTTDLYARSLGEKPHVMENGSQIMAKNVVVQYVATSLADDKGRLTMQTIGQGKALVFKNGGVTETTWKKPAREERTRYYDASNNEIIFTAGPTWIEVLPNDREATYTAQTEIQSPPASATNAR